MGLLFIALYWSWAITCKAQHG